MNKGSTKMKIPLAMEIDSDMAWFAYEVTNDKPGFLSQIPVIRFSKNNRKFNASFLFNQNSRAGLYGNGGGVPDDARGFFVNILLVRDNTLGDGIYNSINPAKRVLYSELGDILIKFTNVEQSGFQYNV